MGTGYVRNDTANNIADGNIINASDLDGEFDAVQSAFNASTGHTHDGTAGEGAPIETIGPSQDVVATASVLRPKTDNTVDLGTTSLEYKDLFLDGTAHIDTLDVDENASITGTLGVTGTTTLGTANITTGTITTADINGGNIDGTIIGATTAAAITGTTITGTTITGTSFVTSGDMTFGDNDRAIFGAGSDLQIYHDGSHSYISDQGTGRLKIFATDLEINNAGNTANYIQAFDGGAVQLFYNNSQKLATTSTGIDITGNATFADNGKAIFGAGSDLQIYHDSASGDSIIKEDSASGGLKILGANIALRNSDSSKAYIIGTDGGALTAYYNGSPKLATSATGVDITGTLVSDGLTVDKTATISTTDYYGASTFSSTLKGAATNTKAALLLNSVSSSGQNAFASIHSEPIADFRASLIGTYSADGSGAGYFSIKQFLPTSSSTLERMRIDSSGNVGIGTSSPSYPLHVSGTGDKVMAVTAGASSIAALNLGNSTNLADGGIRYDNSADALILRASNAEQMRIDSSGRVGINSVPASSRQLEVKNPTGGNAYISAIRSNATSSELVLGAENGNTVISSVGAIPLALVTNGSEAMRIDSSGNVGIGTSSPQGVLDLGASSSGRSITWAKYNNIFGAYSEGSLNLTSNYYGDTSSNAYKTSSTATYGAAGIEISGTGGTSTSGLIQFFVDAAASKTADAAFVPTERMRIDSSGMVNAYYGISVDGGTIKLDGNYPTGTSNVALGDAALSSAASGASANVAIGENSLASLTTGVRNTGVGRYSLNALTTGTDNVSVGASALQVSTGNYNTGLGSQALASNTTASNNTAVGYQALYANTIGIQNVAVGSGSLATQSGATSSYSTAVGYIAGNQQTTGHSNTLVGYGAGYNVTTGAGNTFVGPGTLNGPGGVMTTGSNNTILGAFSGNFGGLDIRTSSNNIVLSDGDGNPRITANNSGQVSVGDSVSYGVTGYTGTQFTVNGDNSDHIAAFRTQTSTAANAYGIFMYYTNSAPNNTTNGFIYC